MIINHEAIGRTDFPKKKFIIFSKIDKLAQHNMSFRREGELRQVVPENLPEDGITVSAPVQFYRDEISAREILL